MDRDMTTLSSRALRTLLAGLMALVVGLSTAPAVQAAAPGWARLTVSVLGPDGEPVVGATVEFVERGFDGVGVSWQSSWTTDASGTATANVLRTAEVSYAVVPRAGSGLGATARGGASPYEGTPAGWDFVSLQAGDVAEQHLLPKEVVLEGRLTVEGGEAVGETEVHLMSGTPEDWGLAYGDGLSTTQMPWPRTTTDADGRYRFEGLAPGKGLTLRVRDAGVEDRYDTFPQFRGGHVVRPGEGGMFDLSASAVVDFEMARGEWITGQIADVTGARAGVRIVTTLEDVPTAEQDAPGQRPDRWSVAAVVTDANGRYRIGPLVPGARYLLRLIPPDESPAYVQDILGQAVESSAFGPDSWVTADPETSLDVVLRSAHVYEGRVVDEQGVPHDSAAVQWASSLVFGTSTTTTSDGHFRIKAVPGWDAPVIAYVRRPPSWYREYLVGGFGAAGATDMPGAEPVDVGDVVVPRSITLRGRIVDGHDGGPASGWSVRVERWSDELGAWSWVTGPVAVLQDGSFTAYGLRPGDRHSIVLEARPGSGNFPYQRLSVPSLVEPANDRISDGFVVPVVPVGEDGRLTYVLEDPIVAHRLASLDVSAPAAIGSRAVEVCARTTAGIVVSRCATLEDGQLSTRLLENVVPGTP